MVVPIPKFQTKSSKLTNIKFQSNQYQIPNNSIQVPNQSSKLPNINSIQFPNHSSEVPNINSIPEFSFSSSSLLLFSSPTGSLASMPKNEIFLRPCLVLSKFDLTFPFFHLVLHFHLFSIQLIHISTLSYKLLKL